MVHRLDALHVTAEESQQVQGVDAICHAPAFQDLLRKFRVFPDPLDIFVGVHSDALYRPGFEDQLPTLEKRGIEPPIYAPIAGVPPLAPDRPAHGSGTYRGQEAFPERSGYRTE